MTVRRTADRGDGHRLVGRGDDAALEWLRDGGPRVLLAAEADERPAFADVLRGRELTVVAPSDRFEADRWPGARLVDADPVDPDWPGKLAGEGFDVVLLSRTLERSLYAGHLLAGIREAQLLGEDGTLLAVVTNVARASTIAGLLEGRFPPRPGDGRIAHHFTRRSFEELCERHGFTVTRCARAASERPVVDTGALGALLVPGMDAPDITTEEFVFEARASSSGTVIERLRRELDDERGARVRAESAAEAVERQRDAVQAELADVSARLASMSSQLDVIARLRVELDAVRTEILEGERSRARAEKKLDEVYASETWRMGSVMVEALGRVRAVWKRSRR